MRRLTTLGAVLALFFATTGLQADQLVLKNGNTLTGKVSQSDGKTLMIDTELSGSVKVNLSDIKSLSTDAPVRVKFADGTKVEEKLVPAGDGQVTLAGKATPISSIGSIKTAPAQWSGDITLAGAFARGNSYTDSINLSAQAMRRTDLDRITLSGGYLYGRQKDKATGISTTTAENWNVAGKYDYFFNDRLYLYGSGKYEKDRIANLQYRVTPSAGLGYQWIETPALAFNTELGLAYLYEKYENVPASAESDKGELSVRGAYHLTGKFNDKVGFFHNLEIFPSIEDVESFFGSTDAGIRATLTKSMFAQFKVQVDYNSIPASGAQKFNLLYVVGVGWTF